jgi:hypothetical protein
MAVVDVTKMWSKSGGSFSSEMYDPFDQHWTLTEGYQVLCDRTDEDPAVVASAIGIPQMGDSHFGVLDAEVNSIVPSPLGPFFWIVDGRVRPGGYHSQAIPDN